MEWSQENTNSNNNNKDSQYHFDFGVEAQRLAEKQGKEEIVLDVVHLENNIILEKFGSQEKYEEERKKIADTYHVLYPETIEFRDNDWYMKESKSTVKEWNDLHEKPENYNSNTRGQW